CSRLVRLIEALDARAVFLDAERHDRLVALVSHLPHLLSFAFARTLHEDREAEMARSLAGGSYRDLMRVAQSDPQLWRGILQENRSSLLSALSAYKSSLDALEGALTEGDGDTLQSLLDHHPL
ncbi:MAG TPA: prephenate dehydrogenase dimerization domain-containing protein, partial [Chthonomonadaceae bacterium]|nr:prephenate dehydrogenase dimerization domain-containing protein [Chthonomonadaceae bacterium]